MNVNNEINNIIQNLNKKEFTKAITTCEKLIKKKIKHTVIFNLYGLAYQKQGLFFESIKAFEKSIELQKDNYLAINNLAVSFKSINENKLAEKFYQECLSLKPDHVIAILNYANLKEKINKFEDAIKLYLKALKFKKEVKKDYIFLKLSDLYLSIGNFDKAKHFAQKIVKKNPDNIAGHVQLSKFINYKDDNKHLLQMEKIIQQKHLNNKEIMNLSFPLGTAYELQKNYEKAFKFFNLGNNLKKKETRYDLNDHIKLQTSIIQIFESVKDLDIVKKTSKSKIIFICGMPRSGTTLIEQIISSHNEVLLTGENNFLSTYIKENYLNGFVLSQKKIIKDIYSKKNFFQDFVSRSLSEHSFESKVFTDKSVQNFLWIGFIKLFFPNAKIIVTERNPKDICLSIFKINFENGFMNFSYDQKDIANFYNLYFDLINYWKKLYPKEIYTVKYENLINNNVIETKKLINFCDLEWDQNCLRHDKNKSAIKTASVSQARKPIYKSSINLSDNYSKYLKEMFSLLKD
jgi:tetratricopeptide (TPR) repeat protein